MILDGWGIATNPEVSAVDQANTPFIDSLYTKHPHSTLEASGLAVGLPAGQMGNSEVGHMNIGAGRVVYQDLVRVNLSIENKTLDQNTTLLNAFAYAKEHHKKVHYMGLVSDGGVHSHIEHLKALCTIAANNHIEDLFIHAFTDGRDTDPKGGYNYLHDVAQHLSKTTGKIATVIGRYYAMDRDNRWHRIKLAYNAMVHGQGEKTTQVLQTLQQSYVKGITDEFINPIIHTDSAGNPIATVDPGDVVLCFNFRTDRGRQITQALTQRNFPEEGMQVLNLHYITLTNYDSTFERVATLFEKDNLKNTLGEVLSREGKSQIRIAETEKYPHVTFFFSGGQETRFEGEKRILCQSPAVATYDLQPEMSAFEIRDKIIVELKNKSADFICLNFANADMVGHTGDFQAAILACETVDQCTKDVVAAALASDYEIIIIADHGNSDCMINEDGTPNTAHTTNLVPFILVNNHQTYRIQSGKLGDLAPSILKIMGLPIPEQMTGNIIIS